MVGLSLVRQPVFNDVLHQSRRPRHDRIERCSRATIRASDVPANGPAANYQSAANRAHAGDNWADGAAARSQAASLPSATGRPRGGVAEATRSASGPSSRLRTKAACVRFAALSFLKMLRTCTFTVPSFMSNRAAISLLGLPSRRRSITESSRGVRSSLSDRPCHSPSVDHPALRL